VTGTPADNRFVTRAGRPDDWPTVSRLLSDAFLASSGAFDGFCEVFEPARSVVVTAGPELVAHAGAYTRRLAVPGAILPAAHVALVAVAPAFRRRGLLSQLMHRQLADLRETSQESVSVLWASEGRIYHRYGYGLAAQRLNLHADLREIRPPDAPTRSYQMRELDPRHALPAMQAIYEEEWSRRVGWSSRTEAWWHRIIADQEDDRATPLRVLLAEGTGGAEGYALWRARGGWDESGPVGTVEVCEFLAQRPDALVSLWRSLLSVDLTRNLRYSLAALDDPVLHLVDEPRRLGGGFADALWIRLINLPAALSSRRYLCPVDVVLDVRDPLLPANSGRWRLAADQAGACCARTRAGADLAVDIRDMGAAYLGGTPLTALAAAGRVTERRSGALAAASATFGWHRQPSAAEMF
jgi:predicted acetyltransferase